MKTRDHSMRGRLLWLLVAAIGVTSTIEAASAYRAARAQADEIFDYHMKQVAVALRFGLASGAEDAPDGAADAQDSVALIVQLWLADGTQVFRSAPLALLPERAGVGYSNVRAHGVRYRIYSLQTPSRIVQVAQDMSVRQDMAGTLALRAILPITVTAPLLMLLAWWVIGASFAPLARVREQVARRQADDLAQVDEAGLPDEVRPLVHELNLLLGRVQQAFAAQKNFVADAAHELRSPLSALLLQAQWLQRAPDAAARALGLNRLMAGIDRAARLVDQLLVLARQQAGAPAGTQGTRLALAPIARLEVVAAHASAQERGIDLGMGQSDDAQIVGDAQALGILIRNLLDNAIRYTPAGGKVDLEVLRDGDRARLVVEDSGPGIARKDRHRAMDRFHRISGSEATGSGLGLAIVKSIAEMHGATVALDDSAALGGLRVVVTFEPVG
jgi:two-component system OmpR family sensor kinase